MNRNIFSSLDPYQLLFPLGIAHAVIGAATWIFYLAQKVPYPAKFHAHHMFSGFLLSFAAGFLLTAIPRFTGARRCSPRELTIAVAISILSFVFDHSAIALILLLFVSGFILRRFSEKTYNPPPHFIFLPAGLLLGIVGSAILTLIEFNWLDSSLALTGKLFLYYGTMLAFLLGIGAKLISALLGWAPVPTHQIKPLNTLKLNTVERPKLLTPPVFQLILFLVSFVLEAFMLPEMGRALRAVCASWIAVQYWHLHRHPKSPGKLPFWIWISAWTLIIGLWVHALFPSFGIHAAHLIFMSGFGLITLLVASRVSLAHGGYALELESSSRIYAATSILIILAALTRFTAIWTDSYFQHLAYAAAVWVVALVAWSIFFIPKILFHSSNIFSFKEAWSKRRACVCGKKGHGTQKQMHC